MNLRACIKTVLLKGVRVLPCSAKRAIFDDIIAKNGGRFQTAGDIAKSVGLTGFVAEGDAGVIRGALDDDASLAKYARDGSWSPHERSLFKAAFAERGGTYLDIGANIGLTVIPISQNPRVECYAFEPEPTNFRYLSENVRVNCRTHNIHLFNLALFDRNATLHFEVAPRHSGDHRISLADTEGELDERRRQTILVPAKRLDDVIMDAVEPICAKIDVQGAEPFVIAGGRRTLSKAILLSFEFWPYSMRRMAGDICAVINFLTEHFQEGSISVGDKDEQAKWQPIVLVAEYLHEYANKQATYDYLDVCVRKT
jgi:FkbM family methyltransferase